MPPIGENGKDAERYWNCPRCGHYAVTFLFEQTGLRSSTCARPATPRERQGLSFVFRRWTDNHGNQRYPQTLDQDTIEKILQGNPPPHTVKEQRDHFLVEVGRHCPEGLGGRSAYFPKVSWVARAGLSNVASLDMLLRALETEQLIVVTTLKVVDLEKVSYGLTFPGWMEVERLRTTRVASDRAFVALSEKIDRGDKVWTEGYDKALRATGHEPKRMATTPSTEPITDEIVAAIRTARIVIVDASEERPNVYWEAGFAYGLGIPVIWCCRKEDSNNRHFNTRQFYHIAYESPQHLQRELVTRIESLGLSNVPRI